MLKVPFKVLVALISALLALGLWWGFIAVSKKLELTGNWIEEWSIIGWIAYGLLAIGLNHVLENLLPQLAGSAQSGANDAAARARRLYVPGMWGKGGSAAGDSDLRN